MKSMKKFRDASPNAFYACDIALERDGIEICCIYSELQIMELAPEDGSPRCAAHEALIGNGKSIRARDKFHAREILRAR